MKKKKKKIEILTLIWVGLLGVRFQGKRGGGGVQNYLPCLKLVRIMLETWQ